MKKLLYFFTVTLLVTTLSAQEESNMEMQDDGMQESQQVWMDFMTPGEPHQMLAEAVGNWTVSQKMWMMPDSEPMVTEGKAVAEMIMGGRYLKTTHSGNIMGMPFNGMSIEGYDNAKKEFVSIWLDNFGTGITYATGKYDEEMGAIVYEGKMTDPNTKSDAWFKQTMEHLDDGTFNFKMYMKGPDGSEFKSMDITYTREEM